MQPDAKIFDADNTGMEKIAHAGSGKNSDQHDGKDDNSKCAEHCFYGVAETLRNMPDVILSPDHIYHQP
jgi:hypothetical protein